MKVIAKHQSKFPSLISMGLVQMCLERHTAKMETNLECMQRFNVIVVMRSWFLLVLFAFIFSETMVKSYSTCYRKPDYDED